MERQAFVYVAHRIVRQRGAMHRAAVPVEFGPRELAQGAVGADNLAPLATLEQAEVTPCDIATGFLQKLYPVGAGSPRGP